MVTTHGEIDVANDLPRNGQRHVLPGLQVTGRPVVEQDDAEEVLVGIRQRHRLAQAGAAADHEAQLGLDVEAHRRPEHRLRLLGGLRCPLGRTMSVPDTTMVPERPW